MPPKDDSLFHKGWSDEPPPRRSPQIGLTGTGKSFAIMRVAKLKTKGHLGAALAHNFRDRETLNADPTRLNQNTILKGADNAKDVIAAWDERAPDKIRKNAVHALEYVMTGSPEHVATMRREEQDSYFEAALKWTEQKHGAENVLSAIVHRDETTPHLQLIVIPLDERGRLNARELVGSKATLSQMQTDFAEKVGTPFGLERGIERSAAKHDTIKEYYARANAPLDLTLSLPERHSGGVLGFGKETEEEWRRRAEKTVVDGLRGAASNIVEQNTSLRRKNEQLEADLEAEKQRSQEIAKIADISSALVQHAIDLGFAEAKKRPTQDLPQKLVDTFNKHSGQFSDTQHAAINKTFALTSLCVLGLTDGKLALTREDNELLQERGTKGDTIKSVTQSLETHKFDVKWEQKQKDRDLDEGLEW